MIETPLSLTPSSSSYFQLTSTARSNLYISSEGADAFGEAEDASFFDKIENKLSTYDSIDLFISEQFGILIPKFLRGSRSALCQNAILDDLKSKLSEEDLEGVQCICAPPACLGDFSKGLLGYAEYIKRKGRVDSSKAIEESVLKSALVSILVKDEIQASNGITEQMLEDCYLKLEELQTSQAQLSTFSVQEIPVIYIQKLVRKFLPQNISEFIVQLQANAIQKDLQIFLEERLFNLNRSCILDNRSFWTWMKVSDDGVSLVCYPKDMERGHDKAYSTFDLFIPKDSEIIPEPKNVEILQIDEPLYLREIQNYQTVRRLPEAERWVSSISKLRIEDEFLIKKEPGYQNLQKVLKADSVSFTTLDLVRIGLSVTSGLQMLAREELLYLHVHPQGIALQKEGLEMKAKLDSFLHLKSLSADDKNEGLAHFDRKRLNVLAQNGYVSLDTDRYGLILFIAELLFLNLDEEIRLTDSEWEIQAIAKLENHISESQYQKLLNLRTLCGGLNEQFLVVLFDYVRRLRERGASPSEIEALKQFGLKLAILPVLKPLFVEALEVDAKHKQRLEQGRSPEEILSLGPPMPSLEKIYEALRLAENTLQVMI